MLANTWTVPLVNERHLKRLLTNYVNLLSRRSNTSRSEQGNSQCASASSDSRSRGRKAETRRSALSVRSRGKVKLRSAENCLLGFNWKGESPQLRRFRRGCEYRVQIVASTGCKIRTGCNHGVRFGIISGRFEFWRETGSKGDVGKFPCKTGLKKPGL
jgi:hypothetical protein